MRSLEEILLNTKVDSVTGCKIWQGALSNGYGRVWYMGRNWEVHRVVWELTTGRSPGALDVLHTCDNRPCCEFAHLFLGTHLDNAQDCMAKGRMHRGEQDGFHKLTEAQVVEIKELLVAGGVQRRIALMYGVSYQTVWSIAAGKTWRHVK